ncbi:MAG: hydrolase, partial [Chlamydiales bacterium]|nr:hydrolase [Chlamydiales bacterium]
MGSLAPRYVIAQLDFDFPDEEATQILRQESIRDIGTIYRIDDRQIYPFRNQLEKTLIEHQKWRKELPKCTF